MCNTIYDYEVHSDARLKTTKARMKRNLIGIVQLLRHVHSYRRSLNGSIIVLSQVNHVHSSKHLDGILRLIKVHETILEEPL